MALVTIITPTYNRAYTLRSLYESLCEQDSNNFEWLIVDDGSSDNTEEVVKEFINQGNFKIRYIKKENGGKHTAVNVGVKTIDTPLTMIVDSDDRLLNHATSIIEENYQKYGRVSKIGVFSFLKVYSSGEIVVSVNEDVTVSSYSVYRIRENRPGDMAEVFRTEILKANPFPEFEGERFLSEDVCWIEISKNYDTVFINKPIYECEYLEGGLTANDKPMKFASPLGSMLRGKQLMTRECGLKANIKGAIIYNCYKKCVDKKIPENLDLTGLNKMFQLITIPMGLIFFKKWNR